MRSLILLAAITLTLACSKKNGDGEGGGCGDSPIMTVQNYFFPSWHPNGNTLVFNYFPVSGISNSPCTGPRLTFKNDSVGLYTMNKDRSGFTRVTEYPYFYSSWSPDGTKLAWQEHGNIYLVPFDGTKLDTLHKQLVISGTFTDFPFFNAAGDSLYVHLYVTGRITLNKVALNGNKTALKEGTFREMSLGSNGRLYYIEDNGEIWSMNRDANDQKKEVAYVPGDYDQRRAPQYYNGDLYYVKGNRLVHTGSNTPLVESNVLDFDISSQGEIVYSQFDYKITESNKQNGVLWIMNLDGTNKRQITFNTF